LTPPSSDAPLHTNSSSSNHSKLISLWTQHICTSILAVVWRHDAEWTLHYLPY
jgi:hypothetical protein